MTRSGLMALLRKCRSDAEVIFCVNVDSSTAPVVGFVRFRDRTQPSEFRNIACTELQSPNVLLDREGNFFLKCLVDPRIVAGSADVLLPYLQCRGAHLSSVEIVRRSSEEVA